MQTLLGKPIVDATEPIVVKIMRRDIDKANQADALLKCFFDSEARKQYLPDICAVAQRIARMPGVLSVRIGATKGVVEKKKEFIRFDLPPEERRRIEAFDRAGYFPAHSVTLVPPKVPTGARAGTKSGTNVREGKAKNVYKARALRHL